MGGGDVWVIECGECALLDGKTKCSLFIRKRGFENFQRHWLPKRSFFFGFVNGRGTSLAESFEDSISHHPRKTICIVGGFWRLFAVGQAQQVVSLPAIRGKKTLYTQTQRRIALTALSEIGLPQFGRFQGYSDAKELGFFLTGHGSHPEATAVGSGGSSARWGRLEKPTVTGALWTWVSGFLCE